MRVVNVTDQTQIVAEAALTIEPGATGEWPDHLPLPATLAATDSAESPQPDAAAVVAALIAFAGGQPAPVPAEETR